MGEQDRIVGATAARIFGDLADPRTVNAAKDDAWKAPLWRALEDVGLTLAWAPEEFGGAGGELADGFDVVRATGRYAVASPVAETLLAGWLLARAGLKCPTGPMTVAPTHVDNPLTLTANGVLKGRVRNVPFASEVAHVAALAVRPDGAHAVVLLATDRLQITTSRSIAGDALDTLLLDGVTPGEVGHLRDGFDARALLRMGAVVRSVQMAAALQAILDITVQYANERIAFERPLAKFQAIQHHLARLAGEVAAAEAVAGSAADAIGQTGISDAELLLEVAAAKVRVGEAAAEGAAIAHQVFGAIGFTREHVLHRFTRRLWAWRDDFGNESYWAVELGATVAAQGADELWPLLAAR